MNNQTMATRGHPRPSASINQQGPKNQKWPPSTPKLQGKGHIQPTEQPNTRIHTWTCYKTEKQEKREKNKNKDGKTLKILYANANGITGKLRSLQSAANLTNSHIIMLTET